MNLMTSVQSSLCSSAWSSTAATNYSDQIDMQGFDGVHFAIVVTSSAGSTGTAVTSLVGTETSTAASTDYTAVTSSSNAISATTTAGNMIVISDFPKPRYRYLRLKAVRTAGKAFAGIVATKYGPMVHGTTQSSTTVKDEQLLVAQTT